MDPYVYPGTQVLRNRRDIRDLESLAEFEAFMTARRLAEMGSIRQSGRFDLEHCKATHRYIFQDVYDGAGEFRTVNIARPGQFYFAFVHLISSNLEADLAGLKAEEYLSGMSPDQFAEHAAKHMAWFNSIHSFRDGHGRTQREFIRQLAFHNGFVVHWSRITRDQMAEASKLSFQKGDSTGLAALILQSIQ